MDNWQTRKLRHFWLTLYTAPVRPAGRSSDVSLRALIVSINARLGPASTPIGGGVIDHSRSIVLRPSVATAAAAARALPRDSRASPSRPAPPRLARGPTTQPNPASKLSLQPRSCSDSITLICCATLLWTRCSLDFTLSVTVSTFRNCCWFVVGFRLVVQHPVAYIHYAASDCPSLLKFLKHYYRKKTLKIVFNSPVKWTDGCAVRYLNFRRGEWVSSLPTSKYTNATL